MEKKICCVTGHRDLPQNQINYVKAALMREIEKAVADGFTCFMSGFAEGVDQYFVEMVMEKQKDDPSLELIAVIPYQKRLDSLRAKGRTYEMLEACHDVVVIQEEYQPSVYSHRNRYMVEHSNRVIAVYDGREKGGTVRTIRFAHQKVKQNRKTWHNAHLNSGRFLLPERRHFYVEYHNTLYCVYCRYGGRRCAALSDAGRKNGG